MSDKAATSPAPAQGVEAGEAWLGRLAAPLFLLVWVACAALAIYANFEGAQIAADNFRDARGNIAGWQQAIFALWTLASLILALTAIVLLRVRRSGAVAGLLSLALMTLCATQIMAGNFWDNGWLVVVQYVLSNLGFFAFILALLVFPAGKFASPWGRGAALAAAAFLAFDVVQQAHHHEVPPRHFLVDPHFYSVNAFIIAGFFAVGAATLVRRLRTRQSGIERQQILWVLAGLVVFILSFFAWIVLNLFRIDFGFNPPFYWGPLGGIALALAFASLGLGFMIALVRYRLYDADAVLGRSTAFAMLSALFGILYLAGEQGLHRLLAPLLPDEASRKLAVAALALMVVTPLKTSAVDWADRRFRKPLAGLKDKLPAMLAELRETASMQELLEQAGARISAALRPQCLAFVLGGAPVRVEGVERKAVDEWLRIASADGREIAGHHPGDALFPLRLALRSGEDRGSVLFGWLLVGPRPDGETYRADERVALTAVAPDLARALRTVQCRETRDATLDEILKILKEGER